MPYIIYRIVEDVPITDIRYIIVTQANEEDKFSELSIATSNRIISFENVLQIEKFLNSKLEYLYETANVYT